MKWYAIVTCNQLLQHVEFMGVIIKMKLVKTIIAKAPSIIRAREIFDNFLALYPGYVVQISGPFITPAEGRSGLPDYIVSGSIIIDDGGRKLNG